MQEELYTNDLAKINLAVQEDTLKNEKVLTDAFAYAKNNNKALHFLGLLSDGGVHSHTTHLKGLIEASENAGLEKVYIHAFTDGRDVDPKSGKGYVENLTNFCSNKKAKIATVIGRYYAMDRDKRWERIKLTYDLLTKNIGKKNC